MTLERRTNCKENAEYCDKLVDEQEWRGRKKGTGLHRRSEDAAWESESHMGKC